MGGYGKRQESVLVHFPTLPLWSPHPPRAVPSVYGASLAALLDFGQGPAADRHPARPPAQPLGPWTATGLLWESTEDKDKECVLGGSGCLCPEGGVGWKVVGKREGKKRKAFSSAASGPTSTWLFQASRSRRALRAGTFRDRGDHRTGPACLDSALAFPGAPRSTGSMPGFSQLPRLPRIGVQTVPEET